MADALQVDHITPRSQGGTDDPSNLLFTHADGTPAVVPVHTVEYDAVVEVRSLAKREIDMRLVPWGVLAETANGLESFERGAFADANPHDVLLHGLEHEAFLGVGQSGQPRMTRHPIGKAIDLQDREDGQHVTFRVAKTARGDEVLALADEGIVKGVSVEFVEVPGGTRHTTRGGRRHVIHTRARLSGASTTYVPAYLGAEVTAVRTDKEPDVADTQNVTETAAPAPASAPAMDITTWNAAMGQLGDRLEGAISAVQTRNAIPDELMEKMLSRLESLEEKSRSSFTFPTKGDDKPYPEDFNRGDWLKLVLRTLSGDTVSHAEMQTRVAAELITTDNLGVVPPAYLDEMIGIIDPSRPFLNSTRRLRTPSSGMSFVVPKITQRPTVGIQAAEKDELTSTTSVITTVSYDAITIGGYGDLSLQILRRSDPSFLGLYVDLLAEAYAIDGDDEAVNALLAETSVVEGGAIDPDDGPLFGAAWANAAAVSRRLTPDTIWLATAAIAQFIDAKSSTTNAPLYSNLTGNFTAAGGVGGSISGLRPVHVPALDDEAVDIIVGPSRAFAWAEDGTYTLQVDVPAKAGRDVGLVGMLWFAPLYPAAFTTYTLES